MSARFNKGGYVGGRDLLLLIIIVLLIWQNPPTPPKTTEATKSPGNMAITIAWLGGDPDVDLWVLGPGEHKAVGHSNKGGRVFNLLRDDLGETGDSMPINAEHAYSRGLPPGEYIINVHCYSCHRAKIEVVNIEINLSLPDGRQVWVADERVELAPGQERTVIRFKLDAKSNVIPGSTNRVFEPLRSAKT